MINKKIGLLALLASFAAGGMVQADLTSYTTGDVLLCFRNANDLVVDAGPISTFTNLAPNTRYTVTGYTGTQLASVGTNSVNWSAFTWLGNNTLFITRPRASANVQTAPWLDASSAAQGVTAGDMATIPPGAVDQLNADVFPASTGSAVIEQNSSAGNPNYPDGESYHDALVGSSGNGFDFGGSFQGDPENTTLSTFTKSSTVQRSDFYQLSPNPRYGVGVYLGYFELNTNGVMTYVAYPTTTPSITSISRSGNVTTITYTTGSYGTYTLRGTNNLATGVSETSWPALSTLSTGDTLTHTVTDTTTDAARFYTITAQ